MSNFNWLEDSDVPIEIKEILKGKQENFRRLRIALGLAISDVAKETGISEATISKIECGNRNLSKKKFLEFVNFYTKFYKSDGFVLEEPTPFNIVSKYKLVEDGKITELGKEILKVLTLYI